MISEIQLSARAVKLIVVGLVLISAALFFRLWLAERDKNVELRGEVTSLNSQASSTTEISAEITAATQKAESEAAELTRLRALWQSRYQEVIREDQDAADWADQPVPDGLRQLACERRTARDRLDSSGAGGGGADAGTNSCQYGTAR